MKTRLYYDTGKQLFFEDLPERVPSIGHTVDMPDGRYKVVESITSPCGYRFDDRNSKRTGYDKLVDIVMRTYPGQIGQVSRFIKFADNLHKAGLIVPTSPTDEFDDVVYLKLELVESVPDKLEEHAGEVHAALAKPTPERAPAAPSSGKRRSRRGTAKLVLTNDAKK